jgi:hypothetical protein
MITRRGFLQFLGVGTAGLLLSELIVPQKTFFLPPVGGWSRGYRELVDWGLFGSAEESLPAYGTIARGDFKLLVTTLNAYGGAVRWVPALGDEIVDLPDRPLHISTSDPLVEWRATYRTARGYEVESGYGDKTRSVIRT